MRNQTTYRIVASALLVLVVVAAAVFEMAAIPVFSWVRGGDYGAGLARFLAGGLSTLLVVFFLFPLLGQREYAQASQKLDRMMRLEPPLDDWAIGVIREQERHLRWLAWRLSGRNLLATVFGGLIAAAVADWWGGSPLTVACLLGLGWGGLLGLAVGIWEAFHPLPPEEEPAIAGIPPLSDLEGQHKLHRDVLRSMGIITAEDLLQAAATPDGRKQLAGRLDAVGPKELLALAIQAELLRSIAGLNEEYAGLLLAAGVKGLGHLAKQDAQTLYHQIQAVERTVRDEDLPTPEMVSNWVAQARRARPLLKF